MSELAARTGLPVATIKYYLREGLLPAARRVTPRLSEYDERHLRRLALLRVLREVGRLPVDRLRSLVETVDRSGSIHAMFATAADAMAPTPSQGGELRPVTRQVADQLIAGAGWTHVRADAPDRENLAEAIEQVITFETHPRDPAELTPYLQAADALARYEISHLDDTKDRAGLLEEMVVGQVVFGEILTILRRLAQEHYSYERFGDDFRT